jgi:hypothetical protein
MKQKKTPTVGRETAMQNEGIAKAAQTTNLLLSDLQEAHKDTDNVAAEILLLEMIEQVAKISNRLERLAA